LESNTSVEKCVINPTIIPFLTVFTTCEDKSGRTLLCPYYIAGVNHNVLDNSKVLQIVNSCLGEPYRIDDSKLAQLHHLGNDASILIGVDEKVNKDDKMIDLYSFCFISFLF
jgi:uncharacterized protein YjhX (UPF0386 family)